MSLGFSCSFNQFEVVFDSCYNILNSEDCKTLWYEFCRKNTLRLDGVNIGSQGYYLKYIDKICSYGGKWCYCLFGKYKELKKITKWIGNHDDDSKTIWYNANKLGDIKAIRTYKGS